MDGHGYRVNESLFPQNVTVILRFTFRTCKKIEYVCARCRLPKIKQSFEDFELWLFKRALRHYRGVIVESSDDSDSKQNVESCGTPP